MKQTIIIACLIMFLQQTLFSQSKENEARVYYNKAEEAYSDIERTERITSSLSTGYCMSQRKQDVNKVLGYLFAVDSLIGENPKSKYLMIKTLYYAQSTKTFPQTKKDYQVTLDWIDRLFNMVAKDKNYPPSKANEITNIKIAVQEKLKEPQIANPTTFSSRGEAFAFISDVLKKYLQQSDENHSNVESVNISWDTKNNIEIIASWKAYNYGKTFYHYSAFKLDLSSVKPDKRVIDPYLNECTKRLNHYYVCNDGNNEEVSYSFSSDFKRPQKVESLNDLEKFKEKSLKQGGGLFGYGDNITGRTHSFDIFFTSEVNSVKELTYVTLPTEKQSFLDIEDTYVRAWEYLLANK